MSGLLDRLTGGTTEAPDELDVLKNLLEAREATLELSAEFERPFPNTKDEPTVVFPYTLVTSDGEEYGAGAKEFLIPDNGLNDTDSPLVKFVGQRLNVGPDDVDFEALAAVEGTTAPADLTDEGDIEVSI